MCYAYSNIARKGCSGKVQNKMIIFYNHTCCGLKSPYFPFGEVTVHSDL
jgi:hypothetical protein